MLRITAACVLLAVAVYLGAFYVPVFEELDAELFDRLVAVDLADPPSEPVTDGLTALIEPYAYGFVCALVVAAGWRWAGPVRTLAAAVAIVGANVTTQLLKPGLAATREHDELGRQVDFASWPSGHVTAAAVVVLAAVLVAGPTARRAIAIGGGILTTGVAFSVVANGWHYPSDALGGLLVAGAWASAAAAWVSSRRPAPAATAAPRRRWQRATG